MTPNRLCFSLAVASMLALTQCATTPTTPPPPPTVDMPAIVLTSAHPSSTDLKLISVSHDKLVTLRMPDGQEATAHIGETFRKKDGTEWSGYTLESASRRHKKAKVVVSYKARVFTGSAPAPAPGVAPAPTSAPDTH